MQPLDPRLQSLLSENIDTLAAQGELARFGVIREGNAPPRVRVLVQFSGGELAPLVAAGFIPGTVAGDVVTGEVPLASLHSLAAVPQVQRVEGVWLMHQDLSSSLTEFRANTIHTRADHPYRGDNVVVGVIDSGIDITHPDFQSANNVSRIQFLWEQWETPQGTESSPAGYSYGVEYTKAQIDAALAAGNPATIRSLDAGSGHGSHVCGIAAGNGRASDGNTAAGTYVGVAPGADIIFVSNRSGTDALGDSRNTLEAMAYIFEKADSLERPCVINLSQGDNIGPHDGTSLLEKGIDNLLGRPGRAICKSAGNAANNQCHASGRLTAGTVERVQFNIRANDRTRDIIDIWYPGLDRVEISITDPSNNTRGPVAPGATTNPALSFPDGTQVMVVSSLDDSENHDNRIYITIRPGAAAGSTIAAGNWTLQLNPTTLHDGRFHAWIERGRDTATFNGTHANDDVTISIPGTSREVIAVGNYQANNAPNGARPAVTAGALAASSSRGPTRDGRIKPEVAAPGMWIMSVRSQPSQPPYGDPRLMSVVPNPIPAPAGANNRYTAAQIQTFTARYQAMPGTSMATPHVTGAVALAFQRNPRLTAQQIKAALQTTARHDGDTAAVPNANYGYGKVDALAFVDYAFPAPLAENWVRIQPILGNWPRNAGRPVFTIHGEESGKAVIELAWDPEALLAPSDQYTGNRALAYFTTATDFDKTITRANGSSLRIQIPKQELRLLGNRIEWTMPADLWTGYLAELDKAPSVPANQRFAGNLYYRVRLEPVGAVAAIAWPADAAIRGNQDAPHMGIIAAVSTTTAPPFPDAAALAGIRDPQRRAAVTAAWQDIADNDEDRQALVRIVNHAVFRSELSLHQRTRMLELWIVAGPSSRRRLDQLLERRVWSSDATTIPIVKCRDRRVRHDLVQNLLDLYRVLPHPDLIGVALPEQLVDDVITEILDPNGQMNQGFSGMGQVTSMGTMLVNINPAEYVRLQCGLLSVDGTTTLANGHSVSVPAGMFQAHRYAGDQASPFYVRTNSELAFHGAILRYAQGSRFPSYDPTANPNAANGINTVFNQARRGGLTKAEMKRALEGLYRVAFTASATGPSDAVRNAFLQALPVQRQPVLLSLRWHRQPTSPEMTGHTVLALRYEGGRVFFKNPQYPGSRPPRGYEAGASRDDPPRRLEDPAQTLESIGDADLAGRIMWYFTPDGAL